MTSFIFLIVLISAASHAGWNLIAKGGEGDAVSRSSAIMLGAAVTALPLLVVAGLPTKESLPFAAASAAVHVGYMLLVGVVYRTLDMSVAYPIVRGASLILSALLAALILGDTLPPLAWIGVVVVTIGVLATSFQAVFTKGLPFFTLLAALTAALTVTTYTLIDGTGVRLSGNALGYVWTMMVLTGTLSAVLLLTRGRSALAAVGRNNWRRGLLGGGLFNLSYAAAVWAMAQTPIGLVTAVRESSILFGAAFAALFLGEKFGPWRWIAAMVIVSGLVLTRLARG